LAVKILNCSAGQHWMG